MREKRPDEQADAHTDEDIQGQPVVLLLGHVLSDITQIADAESTRTSKR